MKKLPIILLFALLYGCHAVKRSSATSNATQQDRQQFWSFDFQQDSTYTLWYFETDSPFYYHPQRGLWAHSGELRQQGISAGQSLQIAHADSSSYLNIKHQEMGLKKTPHIATKWNYFAVIVLILCLLWYLWRKWR